MAIGWLKFYCKSRNNHTIESFFTAIFGKKNYQEVLRYCFDAVLCQDSKTFPASFIFNKKPKNKSYPRNFTLNQGISSLFNYFKFNCHYNEPVCKLTKASDHWIVQTSLATYKAKNICLATPWFITKKLLPDLGCQYEPGLSKICSVSLVYKKDDIQHIPLLGFNIGKEQAYYSFSSMDALNDRCYRVLTIYFKADDPALDINAIIQSFKNQFKLTNVSSIVENIQYFTLPKYHAKHTLFLKYLEDNCPVGIYLIGNYFSRLAIEDCVKRSAELYNAYHHNNYVM